MRTIAAACDEVVAELAAPGEAEHIVRRPDATLIDQSIDHQMNRVGIPGSLPHEKQAADHVAAEQVLCGLARYLAVEPEANVPIRCDVIECSCFAYHGWSSSSVMSTRRMGTAGLASADAVLCAALRSWDRESERTERADRVDQVPL